MIDSRAACRSPIAGGFTRLSRRSAVLALSCAPWAGLASPAGAADEPPVIHVLEVGGATLEVQFAPGLEAPLRENAVAWIERSASAVASYFGHFPVPQVEVLIVPVRGHGVQSGMALAEPSPLLRIRLGRESTPADFSDEGILVHEMVHLAVPRLPRGQQWLHEGLATYVEALARGHAGWVSADAVWQAWRRQMPQGLPQSGDRGLDHTPTWGRTYWGGALFALLADVGMRQRGVPGRGLQHALRGVLARGGDYRVAWPLREILRVADAAVDQATLTELYEQMKDHGVLTDLPSLWRSLGVIDDALRDDAPLAPVRRAILS